MFDVHLMVENVALCIDLYHKAGADHITIHAEATSNLSRFLKDIYFQVRNLEKLRNIF